MCLFSVAVGKWQAISLAIRPRLSMEAEIISGRLLLDCAAYSHTNIPLGANVPARAVMCHSVQHQERTISKTNREKCHSGRGQSPHSLCWVGVFFLLRFLLFFCFQSSADVSESRSKTRTMTGRANNRLCCDHHSPPQPPPLLLPPSALCICSCAVYSFNESLQLLVFGRSFGPSN